MKHLLLSTLVLFACSSCGSGGGGGDDFIGAANLSVRTSPSTIDTGDRTQVTIDVRDVHENGILLKVRIPAGLAYVPSSAFLVLNDDEIDIGPDKNVADNNRRYLVFFLDDSEFDEDGAGVVKFQLVGNDSVADGEIEVDADVNDPLVNDNNEFDIEAPEFGAEDSTGITVTN